MPRQPPQLGTPARFPNQASLPGVSVNNQNVKTTPAGVAPTTQDVQTPNGAVTIGYKPYATTNGIQLISTGIEKNVVFQAPLVDAPNVTGDATGTFTYALEGTELKTIPISVSGSIQQQITGDFNGQPNVNLGTETLTPSIDNGNISFKFDTFQGRLLAYTQTVQIYNPYNGSMQNVGVTKQLQSSFNPDTNQVTFTGSSFTPYDVPLSLTPQVTTVNLNTGIAVPAVYQQTLNVSEQGLSTSTGFLGFLSEGKAIPTVSVHNGDTLTNYTLAGNQLSSTSYTTKQLPAQTITTTPIATTAQFNGIAAINAVNTAANLGQLQYNIGVNKPTLSATSLDYTVGKPEQVSNISKTAAKNIRIIDQPTESLQQSLTTSYIENNLPGFIKGNGFLNELAITAAKPTVSVVEAGASIKIQNPNATPLSELPGFYAALGLSAVTGGLVNYPQFLGTNQRTPTAREALTIAEDYTGSFLTFGGLTKGVGVLRSQLGAKIVPTDLANIRENFQKSQDIIQTNAEQPQSTSVVLRTAESPNSTNVAIQTIKGTGAIKTDYINELANGKSYILNQNVKPIQFAIRPEANQAIAFKNIAMDIGERQQRLAAPIQQVQALPKPSGYELQFKDTSANLNALTARAYTSYTSGAKGKIQLEQVTQSRDVYGTSQNTVPEFSVLKSSSGKIIELTATKNTGIRRLLGLGAKTTKLTAKNQEFNYDIGNANTGFLTEKTGLGDTSILNREMPIEQAALRTDLYSRTGFVINRGSTSAELNQLAQQRGIRINGEVSGVESGYKFSGQPIRFIQAGKVEDIQTPGKQLPKSTYSSLGIKDLSVLQNIFEKGQNRVYTGFKKPESTYSKEDIARIDNAISKNAKGIAFLIKDIYTGKQLNVKSDLTPADLIRINEKLGSKEYAEGLASLAQEIYAPSEKPAPSTSQSSNAKAEQQQTQIQKQATAKSTFVPRLRAENIAMETEAQVKAPIEIIKQRSANLNKTKETSIQKSVLKPISLQSTKRRQDTRLKNLSTSKAISTNESIVRSIEKAATTEATTAKTLQTTKELTTQTTLTTARTTMLTTPRQPPTFSLPLFFGGANNKQKKSKKPQPFNNQKNKYAYTPDFTSRDLGFTTRSIKAYSKLGVFRPILKRGKKR